MALIGHSTHKERGVATTTWEGLTSTNNVGSAEDEIANFPDKTVQVVGTFNGATLVVQGTNDGTNWATMHDVQGNDLSFTATGIGLVLENPIAIRPSTSGGGGSQNLTLVVVSRR